MRFAEIIDSRRRLLVQRRDQHIRKCEPQDAQHCTSRLDELDEIAALLHDAGLMAADDALYRCLVDFRSDDGRARAIAA